MRDVLPDLEHVTPEWLTEVLQDQGHLEAGRVTAVHLKTTRPTAVSLVAHLEVQYTADAAASVPSQLFLKTSRPDLIAAFPLRGQKEVAFYTRIAAAMPAPLVVRCYDAVYAPEAKKFHLVLEDVSASHFQATVWPVPPLHSQCVQAIDGLAQLHAHWWDHAGLAQDTGARPTEVSMQQGFHWVEHTLPEFLDFLGDRLSRERRARLEQPLLRRYHTQLLTHGIVGYEWDACWYDYRLAAIRNLFIPMRQWAVKGWPAIWWGHLERALLAFEDLQCRELL